MNKKEGFGCFYHRGGASYEGEWRDDIYNGKGREKMLNGDVFEGEYRKGIREGKGKLTSPDGSYV